MASETLLLTTFHVRDALCGLDAGRVQEVIRPGPITRVHHAPEEVVGIMNLRGRIVTVIDAAQRLGFPKTEYHAGCRIFLLEARDEFIGLLVDRVGEVLEVERERLEAIPSNVIANQRRMFLGVCRTDAHAITLLDADRIMAVS